MKNCDGYSDIFPLSCHLLKSYHVSLVASCPPPPPTSSHPPPPPPQPPPPTPPPALLHSCHLPSQGKANTLLAAAGGGEASTVPLPWLS